MRSSASLWLAAAFGASLLVAAEQPPLAWVDEDAVGPQDLREEFVRRHGGHSKFLGGESEIRAFLDQVIDQRLLLQEAYRLGLDELPEVVAEAGRFAAARASEILLREEVDDQAEPTEAQIEEAWRTRTTTLYTARQIVLATREEAERAAREMAEGADFERLARERSIARSRTAGGLLGSLGWGSASAEWEERVFALAPGETSPPFRSPEGWEVVRLIGRREVDPPVYEKAKPRVEAILAQRMRDERRRAFASELRRSYAVRRIDAVDLAARSLVELRAAAPATELVRWRDGALTVEQLAHEVDLEALAALPVDVAGEQVEQALDRSVFDALLRREAEARRIVDRPELAREIRRHREGLMESALYADHLLRGITASEEEVRVTFEGHRDAYAEPERRRVSHLLVASREEAEAQRQLLGRGEEFAQLVRQSSIDAQTRGSGGDLGWITASMSPPGFEPVLALAVGEISQPLESKYGWHLVRCEEIVPARPRELAEVRELVREQLLERKKTERRREWIAKLREATPIEIDDEAIRELAAAGGDGEPVPAPPSH